MAEELFQKELLFSLNLIESDECLNDKVTIIKKSGMSLACVKTSTFDKLILRGWGTYFQKVEASMRNGDFKYADLRGADFSGADLRGADFSGADLTDANLYESYLYGADLRGSLLLGTNLSKAGLHGTNFFETVVFKVNFTNSIIYETNLESSINENNSNFLIIKKDSKIPFNTSEVYYQIVESDLIRKTNPVLQAKRYIESENHDKALDTYLMKFERSSIEKQDFADMKNIDFDRIKDKSLLLNLLNILSNESIVLKNDDLSSWFFTWKENDKVLISLTNYDFSKSGKNSMLITIDTTNGITTFRHDYSKYNLQDWSIFKYLEFWLKGQNSGESFKVILRGENRGSLGEFFIHDNSNEWKKIQIPLHSSYNQIDGVRELEFWFDKNTMKDVQLIIDDLQLREFMINTSSVKKRVIASLEA